MQTALFLPGILYGKGEDDFYHMFENCLGSEYLEVYINGDNMIPVTYIKNCSTAL